ncbi:Siderophore synthetase component [Jatrophihabitans endophyticus]|uniref:Siderophore synthetase component n=1 Tax=Jatrophihabitans endophyticus TaxID=1206085 RepID=A0A1M5SVM2_9ACTN|nr:IucA/IucC family siderophore biosynthesis protein [Jatrophihabitans endophyticus]SHH42537.1 Siderophore synthetase component [Jatrophihabitans endophyticus]
MTGHLAPDRLAVAQRALVTKALSEFAHERVICPVEDGDGYVVPAADGVRYVFRARRLPLDHWVVDPGSVRRVAGGETTPLDAQQLVHDLQPQLGLSDDDLPVYLEELASTLAGRMWKLRPDAPTSANLLDASFQQLEAAMTEGHPAFVANNGRLGYGVADHAAYAPETGARVRLVWLAVRRDRSVFATVRDLTYDELLAREFHPAQRAAFAAVLTDLALDPADYRVLPCHPWQWDNKVAVSLAPEVARHDIVYLGESADEYQAQQSVRTFYNTSHPERAYVKTALSVLNMGFMRGLSPKYMTATPAVNDWVADVVRGDGTLRDAGFDVLREIAAVGFHPRAYDGTSGHGKLLSGLWRESPASRVEDGERLATMTSLLHVDAKGTPYVAELVAASGLAPRTWVRRYLDAYLVPVLHCFYAHELVFMPHGENVILVLRDHVPVRLLMKDIGEEVAVLSETAPLPPEIERIRANVPDELQLLSVFVDVLDCFLRFLAGLLDDAGVLPAADFWTVARDCAREYQAAHPELAARFAAHDLFAPAFELSCLNRLQLRNNRQMVDLADPASALALAGPIANPLAG